MTFTITDFLLKLAKMLEFNFKYSLIGSARKQNIVTAYKHNLTG